MTEKTHRTAEMNPRIKEAREHAKAARASLRREASKSSFPTASSSTARQARKEMLLAMRSLLDAAIERMEKKSE